MSYVVSEIPLVRDDVGTVCRGGGETNQQTGAQQVPVVPGPAGVVPTQ